MIEQNRGLSFVAYTYEGGPRRFTCTFPRLKPEHVRVLVGDPKSPRTVLGKWINSTTVEIPDQSEYLTTPYSVLLRRITPFAEQAILFQDAATLPADQLNTAIRQLLFVQQEVAEFGVGTGSVPGSGLPGNGGGNLPDIQTIVDQVVQSPAYQILQERIPEIDANAELIMQELLRSNEFFDTKRDYGDRISEASTRLALIEDGDKVTAEQITTLLARMVRNETDVAASFDQVNRAIATETEARVEAITDMHAQITSETGTLVAQAVDSVEVVVNKVESRVTTNEGRLAAHGESIAATNESLKVVANDAQASTEWRQLFAAQYGPAGATGASVAAAVKQQIDAKATPDEARSIANTSVTAFANGTFAALQQSYTAYVGANDAKWSGTWSLRINGGDPNNPVVAGIALSAYPGGSDFVVQSDRFAITTPTAGYGARKFPFVVGTVGGLSTVGITGQLLVDGSITANKLTVNSLAAITANMGTVNGGTFKTHTLDVNGNIVDAHEFRVELSNVGTWPIWVGAGDKNENNAVFWVDRSGNAGFKGRVSAPNIVGNFNRLAPVDWTGSVSMNNTTGIVNFTLPAPVLLGESHTPLIVLSAGVDHASSDNGRAFIYIQKLVGAAWVTVDTYFIIQGSGHKFNHALNYVGDPTTAEATYRVAIADSSRGDRLIITKVRGFIQGLR
ncbi:phage tail fiber protein [Xanthomonas axonopodis]|uniref:phage tail fiber domain-containing protein n=1 Tax=Xanthomonas axonopodis TaxID=53413 RepID=UPI0009974495|nr:phage tail fiber protein [Xanthomonas axonopodis]